MKDQIGTMFQTEVSRKEFLGMSGLAVASIFGFGTIIKLLSGKSVASSGKFSNGYSSSKYGGSKK